MNREVVGGGGASIYPLIGDISSSAGSPTVSVTGLVGIPLVFSALDNGDFLVYDETVNNWVNETVTIPPAIELQTNGTDNSSQTLLNLAEGTNITLTESGGTVTINAPTPTGASTIITNFQPGSVLTGTGSVQTVISFTIAASTIPIGKGVEFVFNCEGSTGAFGSNLWNLVIGGISLGWGAVTSTAGYASGGFRIVNDNGSTTSNSIVLLPLIQNTISGTELTAGSLQTSTLATASSISVTLTWNGPNTITTQVIQAYLKFI
jgi:hypothetical protein